MFSEPLGDVTCQQTSIKILDKSPGTCHEPHVCGAGADALHRRNKDFFGPKSSS